MDRFGICLLPGCALMVSSFFAVVMSAQNPNPRSATVSVPAAVNIQVDLKQDSGPFEPLYNWFGYDEANYTTGTHGPELLKEMHDLSPVPVYIRTHHLLTSGDGRGELKFSSTNVYS